MRDKICLIGCFSLLAVLCVLKSPPSVEARFVLADGKIKIEASIEHETGLRLEGENDGEFSILRSTAQLEPDVTLTNRLSWHAIFRLVKDGWGQYESEEHWLSKEYWDEDNLDEVVREFYFDADVAKRLHLRFGRQQIVWGETDGFRMLDLINPLDGSWKALGEDFEDQRIPLWSLRATLGVPCLNGVAEFVFIPGWDDPEDRVNHNAPSSPLFFDPVAWRIYDREDQLAHWGPTEAPAPAAITLPATSVTTDYPEQGLDQYQLGFRWSGDYKGFSYTIADFYSFMYDPIARYRWGSGSVAPTPDPASWINGVPVVTEAVLDYPRTNMIGGSFNWYSNLLNTVFRGEFAYWDALEWNTGTMVPFDDAVKKKNTLRYMLGTDGNYFLKWLNETRTFLISTQIFQTILLNYDDDDEILSVGAYPAKQRHVETILTLLVSGNYRLDTI
ncbi:MAG TPA: hypothetical protein PLG17_10130, partial [Thermodesulfobacteriota bacterium]|nr:hypothetical protein [Thermodesulfobacteriota bacterium]